MACETYNSVATQQIVHTAQTLPANFCPSSWQDLLNAVGQYLTSMLPGTFGGFTIGADTPSANDRDKLWFRLNSSTCQPLGWYIYYNGGWFRAQPHPVLPGTIIDYWNTVFETYIGTQAQIDAQVQTYVEALEGGDDGNGPFWYLCDGTNGTPDLRGRYRMGAGYASDPGATPGDDGYALTDRPVAETGGEENHLLSVSELPSDLFDLSEGVTAVLCNKTGGTKCTIPAGCITAEYVANPFQSPAGTRHNNVAPYLSVYPIMKSTRLI